MLSYLKKLFGLAAKGRAIVTTPACCADSVTNAEVKIVPCGPSYGSQAPVCVACLVQCRDPDEQLGWSLFVVRGLQFPFCPSCGPGKQLSDTDNRRRARRCIRWAHFKLNAEAN